MKALNQDKLEFWRSHIEQSKRHPEGIQAYCKVNNLATSNYYNWRHRILNLKPSKVPPKKSASPFIPVIVSSAEPEVRSHPQRQLPDSRWVSEIIINVIRGLL